MRRQQIIETIECDDCGEETDKPVGYTVEIGRTGMSGGAPIRRTLDLCDKHAKPVAELHELLRRVRPVAAGQRRASNSNGVEHCDVCGADVSAAHICSHIVKAHRAHAPMPPECPDCGKIYDRPTMLAHRKSVHGYDHRVALLASLPTSKRAR